MGRYIPVAMPLPTGGWRAYFPDFADCRREADNADAALDSAASAAKAWMAQLPKCQPVPFPRSIDQIRADQGWADQRQVNWSNAIIRVVQL
jgi:predicted RNase H-like HicB family nuclease